ncbi:hypothetical protein AAFF_G00215070, partial [Aldrovandia affinis]
IVSPSQSARSLGVTLDNQLCFSSHIAAITRTCRFSLHNIRRIRPFLTQEATQLLPLLAVSPLLCPDPSLVERPSAIGQDRGITCNLPQETQNPPLQTPLPLNSVHLAKLSSPLFTCSTLYSKKKGKNKEITRTFSFPVLQHGDQLPALLPARRQPCGQSAPTRPP